MATWYVHHGGNGASPGTDPGTSGSWPSAFASLSAATSSGSVTDGDTIKVSDQHNWSGTAGWTAKGTNASPINVSCVSHTDTSVESTGAVENSSSANYHIYGVVRCRGVNFKVTTTAGHSLYIGLTNYSLQYFKDCIFELAGSHASSVFNLYSAIAPLLEFVNCRFRFSNASQIFQIGNDAKIVMLGGAFADTGTAPSDATGFFRVNTSGGGGVEMHSVDMTNIAAGKVFSDPSANAPIKVYLSRCKFGGTAFSDWTVNGTQSSEYRREDADGFFHTRKGAGTLKRSLTVVKNGGVGWSVEATTATGQLLFVKALDAALDLSTAKNLTLEIAQYNAGGPPAALTADQCKLIVEYPDGTALGKLVESTSISTSTQRWDDNLGAEITSNITKQKLSVTVPSTLGAIGPVTAWLLLSQDGVVVNVDSSPAIV